MPVQVGKLNLDMALKRLVKMKILKQGDTVFTYDQIAKYYFNFTIYVLL